MDQNEINKLRIKWKEEEENAHINGWDFSYLDGRMLQEETEWDFKKIVQSYLTNPNLKILDIDTGGGEFLLSLGYPYKNTSATEAYPPNIEICRQKLIPLGINFVECSGNGTLPFDDNEFDIMINRHGDYNAKELSRVLKPDGIFLTQQVGEDNDRDLVLYLLPDSPKPFPGHNLKNQEEIFKKEGFEIIDGKEDFKSIKFFDVEAVIWFAKIIEWEFSHFSVEKCFNNLLRVKDLINKQGYIEGKIHRFLIIAKNKK